MMNSKHCYEDLVRYRKESWQRVLDKKLGLDDFVHASFNYLQQQRYKPFVKAHDREAILFNYLYWLIQIERKVLTEKMLFELGLGDIEIVMPVIFMHIKRRDQMVRRILSEKKEKIAKACIIFDDTVELKLESGEILYTSIENLEKIDIFVKDLGKSVQGYYTSLLKLKDPRKD